MGVDGIGRRPATGTSRIADAPADAWRVVVPKIEGALHANKTLAGMLEKKTLSVYAGPSGGGPEAAFVRVEKPPEKEAERATIEKEISDTLVAAGFAKRESVLEYAGTRVFVEFARAIPSGKGGWE